MSASTASRTGVQLPSPPVFCRRNYAFRSPLRGRRAGKYLLVRSRLRSDDDPASPRFDSLLGAANSRGIPRFPPIAFSALFFVRKADRIAPTGKRVPKKNGSCYNHNNHYENHLQKRRHIVCPVRFSHLSSPRSPAFASAPVSRLFSSCRGTMI